MRDWREIPLWKDVTEAQWNDWLWQLTHTIRTLDELKQVINLTPDEEEGVRISSQTIPLNINPVLRPADGSRRPELPDPQAGRSGVGGDPEDAVRHGRSAPRGH